MPNEQVKINQLNRAKEARFKTQWNAKSTVVAFIEGVEEDIPLFPDKYEKNSGKSQTIPDQSLSVQEILRRYSHGLPMTDVKTPIYEGDQDTFPDLSKMDLADREAYLDEQVERLIALKDDLKRRSDEIRQNDAKTKQKQKEADIKAVADEINRSKRGQNPDPQNQNRDIEDIDQQH